MENRYNPDVLNCIANLSNDEVFTPPSLANQLLDLLPSGLFESPETKFLDPFTKSGVFLREIVKRLDKGLESVIPDRQKRIDHIMHNQVYGIACTELTSLLARRSVYCSKTASGKHSVTKFETPEGNILYKPLSHTWEGGKCIYCGASQAVYDRGSQAEQYAYQFIHTDKPAKIFGYMKFDVIIGNPPYQLQVNESGKGLGAIPLYNKFVEQAIRLSPRYLSMIIPSRWFAGGVGLDDFRKMMLSCGKISNIVDFTDSNDCFPGVDINGGVCYFLWQHEYDGPCAFCNITNSKLSNSIRKLNEFDIFIRRNESVSIIHKVLSHKGKTLSHPGGCSSQTPYGFLSTFIGKSEKEEGDCEIVSSKGWMYVAKKDICKGLDSVDSYKVMISKLSCEHAGNPNKDGQYRVLSRMEILSPNQICTQSYLVICPSKNSGEVENTYTYLRTKFVRFLILQTLVGMNISISNFQFVPWVDFSHPWTDEMLYEKYKLTQEEIEFIESMIRPME